MVQAGRARPSKVLALGLALVACAGASTFLLPLQDWLGALGATLQGFGLLGALLFAAIYVAAAMALVPASALSLAAGLLYGPAGIALAWASMMVVAAISFPLSRRLLAGRVRPFVEARRRLRVVADIIDQEGWRMVLLVRVSGIIPFGLQNYVLGVTRIGLAPYLAATSIGVLPSILLYAGAGAFGNAAATGDQPLRVAVLALAAAAAFTLIVVTVRKVRARLGEPDVPPVQG